ncbi:MAG: DUF4395 domain-containing protein [Anaerolineales bacterium]|nr:DUF4395 domain-containing protein [Anaerolineales bacterium]
MTIQTLQKVDHAALKANQLTIITLNILAFVFNAPILALIVTAATGLGALLKFPGFILLYRYFFKPLGILKPDVLDDNPEPHRFAQFVGFLFMATGSALIFFGSAPVGWLLVWVVTFLAALNAFGGFCVGCAMYYWFARLNLPGFTKTPPAGIFPGMKPKTGA